MSEQFSSLHCAAGNWGFDPSTGLKPSLFVSCASNEFKSHRVFLAEQFRSSDLSIVEPITQEDFRAHPGSVLKLLHDRVRYSSMVLHLIGNSVGWTETPPQREIDTVLQEVQVALEKMGRSLPPKELLPDFNHLSYTQWEAVLAYLYRKDLFVFLPRNLPFTFEKVVDVHALEPGLASQQRHISWLIRIDKHMQSNIFETQDELWRVVSSVVFPHIEAMKNKAEKEHQSRRLQRLREAFEPRSPQDETARELRSRGLQESQFYGRRWLFESIENWLDAKTKPVFWLQADAGFGKSRFSAELTLGEQSIHHGAVVDAVVFLTPTASPISVLARLCAQLRTMCPNYRQDFEAAWARVDWDRISIPADWDQAGETQEQFVEQLIEPLLLQPLKMQKACEPGTKYGLIVIDGLDELLQSRDGRPVLSLEALLTKLLTTSLPNFRLVLTSRPAARQALLHNLVSSSHPVVPKLDRASLRDDAREFICGEFPTDWMVESCMEAVLVKSKACMLYLYYLSSEIHERAFSPSDISSLPFGMADYYLHKMNQYFAGDQYEAVFVKQVKPCLDVIAAGERTELSVADVEACCGLDQVNAMRRSLRMMMVQRSATPNHVCSHDGALMVQHERKIDGVAQQIFVPFHLSFMDWLLGRSFDEGDDGTDDDDLEREKRQNHDFRVSAVCGDRSLADWTIREFEQSRDVTLQVSSSVYWMRQGVDHALRFFSLWRTQLRATSQDSTLPEYIYLIKSVEVLGWLKSKSLQQDARDALGRSLSLLSTALAQSTREDGFMNSDDLIAMQNVNQFILFDLIKDICSTDITDDVVWWIGRTQLNRDEWWHLVNEMLKLEWVVRFAAASGQAARYRRLITDTAISDEDRHLAKSEINSLLNSPDVTRQEMGCYAVGEIAKHEDELVKRVRPDVYQWVKQVSSIDLYFAQSVIADVLIDLTLKGAHERVEDLDQLQAIEGFWNPIWVYNRQDIARVLSHRILDQATPLERDVSEFESDIDQAVRLLKAREVRIIALCEKAGDFSEALAELLHLSELDDSNDDTIFEWLTRENISPDERISTAVELLKLLFTHTSWRVSENGAAVLAELHARSHDADTCLRILDALIDSLDTLEDEWWRVIYGTIESCYLARHFDTGKEFEPGVKTTRLDYCIKKYHHHANVDIRGLVIEEIFILVEQPDQGQRAGMGKSEKRIEYPKHYTTEIDALLLDPDIWVLEHVHQMFQTIKEMHESDLALGPWIEKRLNWVMSHPLCLLARVSQETKQSWIDLPREQFLACLQQLQRAILESGTK